MADVVADVLDLYSLLHFSWQTPASGMRRSKILLSVCVPVDPAPMKKTRGDDSLLDAGTLLFACGSRRSATLSALRGPCARRKELAAARS